MYDEIDLERGVAVQRVKTGVLFNISSYWANSSMYAGSAYCKPAYFTDIMPLTAFASDKLIFTGYYSSSTYKYLDANMQSDGTINVWIKDGAFENNTERNSILQSINVCYVLAEPIETPIDPADLADLTALDVEAGGSLTFCNQHGDDYHMPLPNQETFMIKTNLGGA